MSPLLPQYTKALFRDEPTPEEDRLLDHPTDVDDSRATYPPTALGEAGASSSAVEPVKTFALPSHLANYELDGEFTLWKGKTAICGRERTKQETIESLASAFPMLYRRDPRSVHVLVPCPPPAGSTEARYSEITDVIWDDIVRGKPDNLKIKLDLTHRERARQWFNCIAMFGAPFWLAGLGIIFSVYFSDQSSPSSSTSGDTA